MRPSVSSVLKAIEDWKTADRMFEAKIATGVYVEAEGVIRGRRVDGSQFELHSVTSKLWSRRVARLEAEAKRRQLAKDWEWFDWLVEFGGMIRETELENFEDLYTTALTRASKQAKALARGRTPAAHKGRRATSTAQAKVSQVERALATGASLRKLPDVSKSQAYRIAKQLKSSR